MSRAQTLNPILPERIGQKRADRMNDKISTEMDWRLRVFDSLSFPTLILKPDRTIISANQIFLEKIGTDLEQIAGRTCREIFHRYIYDPGLPCSEEECPLANTLKHRKGHSVLRKIKHTDGEDRWEDRVFSPILDESGQIKYIIESVRDMTRVKNLEQMFSGIRKLMNRIIQSSASAIVAADMQGRVLLMNQSAEALFGYTAEDVASIHVRSLYPEGTAREIMEILRDEGTGGKGKLPMTQVTILTRRGEKIPVEMTGAIIYENDREAATMGIINDLREKLAVQKKLIEAQTQVVQSEKMASLGRLAAGVAHEINNPLTGITMYGNVLREKLGPDHPLQENLAFILEDADRCRNIVKNLLVYSRQTNSCKKTVSLPTLVEESLGLIRDQKLFMKIRLVKEMPEEPMRVHADKNQLSQVFINLVMNAIDAMDGCGTLTFRSYRKPDEGTVCIEVEDTGCGIPEEHISKVFDPFFTTKKPGQGTGLGLSTVYGLTKENNGRVSIRKTGPTGTTFILEFPESQPNLNALFDSIG